MTPREFANLYIKHGSIRKVRDALIRAGDRSAAYGTFQLLYACAVREGFLQPYTQPGKALAKTKDVPPSIRGSVKATPTWKTRLPEKGRVKRYILTCAQNNTPLHKTLWRNLLALEQYYKARLMVARFMYDKRTQSSLLDKGIAIGKQTIVNNKEIVWVPEIEPYLADDRVELAPGLVWCGEMNILPTAVRPLSGLESYTGRKSAIFPHAKLAMESIPSNKYEGTKFIYTTGTATQRNYIQRKAGLKAEFHHCYGALLVEVDSEGNWFVRQLNADSEGTLHDLTLRIENGKVTDGHRVEAVTWGDVHIPNEDKTVRNLAWGKGGMTDVLQPKYQFLHDILDFRSRNHHDRKDPHKRFKRWIESRESVKDEVLAVASFLRDLAKGNWPRLNDEYLCRLVIVEGNHDNALERWLREGDFRLDPINAVYYLEANLAKYQAMAAKDENFHLVEWAIRGAWDTPGSSRVNALPYTQFLREDESFVICPDANGGIECGIHGHLGPNGSRGGANTFARMGRKSNVGHTHSAGIHDGVYTAGCTSLLDLEWNKGPSSWSHSSTVTYPNGKRAILTIWGGKWRA